MTDNQRYDSLSCHSNFPGLTPNFDLLAKNGIDFQQAYTPCPLCTPARAAYLTGMNPSKAGIPHNPHSGIPELQEEEASLPELKLRYDSIPQLLKRAGYQTIHSGKWHVGHDNPKEHYDLSSTADDFSAYQSFAFNKGLPYAWKFQELPPDRNPYRSKISPYMTTPLGGTHDIQIGEDYDAWVVNRAIRYIRERDPNQPFFINIATQGPHPPYIVFKEYLEKTKNIPLRMPTNFNANENEPHYLRNSYFRTIRNEWSQKWEDWAESYRYYLAFTSYIDSLFGKVMACLQEEGLAENTLVVATTDHGEMLGQHELTHKMCPYQEALHIPLLMSLPNQYEFSFSNINETPCSLIDLAPTFLEIAGLPISKDIEGNSLVTFIRDAPKLDRAIRSDYHLNPLWTWQKAESWNAVIKENWKLIINNNDNNELFNLSDDPFEQNNLAQKNSNKVNELLDLIE